MGRNNVAASITRVEKGCQCIFMRDDIRNYFYILLQKDAALLYTLQRGTPPHIFPMCHAKIISVYQ